MTDNKVTITTRSDESHGPLLSSEDTALLMGVDVADLRACVAAQRTRGTQAVRLPQAWIEQGRSRADVYQQVTGRADMAGAIEFWRALNTKDH